MTVLPRGRSEDIAFRQRLRTTPSVVKWTLLYALTNKQGYIIDELFACGDDHVHSEGYRLLWYRSTRKAEQDKSRRARLIQKATAALSDLRQRLQGPRGRDIPPGNTRSTERANQVPEGDALAFHPDVEAERGGDHGSGAGRWRIPSLDQ